jgi:hypothetical protein
MKSEKAKFLFPMTYDTVRWAGTIVKTWTHFVIFGGLLGYLTFDIVLSAAERGTNRSVYGAVLIVFFQILLLYGLRKLYMIITIEDKSNAD